MLMRKLLFVLAAALMLAASCERVDHSGEKYYPDTAYLPLDTVAKLFSVLPIEAGHMREVHDAVSSSSGNGYDEEYLMKDLFESPGAGVGMDPKSRAVRTKSYARPLKELIAEHFAAMTKAAGDSERGAMTPEEYLDALEKSDIQIYWPYSEKWNGREWPIITFDPGNGAEVNVGYRMREKSDGSKYVEEVIVDEEMAAEHPVWVVNRNDDCQYESLEMIKKRDPEWGTGGGSIVIRPSGVATGLPVQASSSGTVRSLVLKDFLMHRNYDCWFAGASEFFFKVGSVENFTASTEAELKLYNPQITDFMLVVKRNQVGQRIPMNIMLVSQWTDQLDNIAFLLTEDDGGTRTKWKCSAVVKVKSKSYGFDVSLPFNSRDDIVWRGELSARYLEKYDGITSRFGDVDLTFSFLER